MLIYNYIKTTSDVNGNSRRGWHIIDTEGLLYNPPCEWWVEEGGEGNEPLKRALKTIEARNGWYGIKKARGGEYTVPVSEYKRLRKELAHLDE